MVFKATLSNYILLHNFIYCKRLHAIFGKSLKRAKNANWYNFGTDQKTIKKASLYFVKTCVLFMPLMHLLFNNCTNWAN